MDSLTDLWLRDNSLSGGIPQELEDLNLTALHLSGNSFWWERPCSTWSIR